MSRLCLFAVIGASVVLLALPGDAAAQVIIHNENVNGDLSNDQSVPTAFTLVNGVNSILGNVTGLTDRQDWITVAVPSGFRMTAYVNSAYLSLDSQGFTGFQRGTSFVGSSFSAVNYEGYSLYGTGAQNGSYPAMNLIGQNLLPIMADPAAAPGARGFSPPLEAGDYTFLIQQLGASTDYQFDFIVAPVPEPGSLCLAALGTIAFFKRPTRLRLLRRWPLI